MNSCGNTKYLPENESLFVGGKINVVDTNIGKSEREKIENYLSESIRPKPNKSFLGMRWKLYVYNVVGTPKKEKGGLKNWLRDKVGEPPVLASSLNLNTNNRIFENQLQNIGYLRAEVSSSKETDKQKTKAYFEVLANEQFTINEVKFPLELTDASRIANDIQALKEKTILKVGDAYSLDNIKNERIRIDAELKNKGYYYFNPEYIIMKVDTGISNNKLNIKVELKWDEMPRNAYERFIVDDVIIMPNYRLPSTKDSSLVRVAKQSDTLIIYNDIKLVESARYNFETKTFQTQATFRPATFYQAMQLKPGEVYNQRDHNLSLNRLVNMGTFKFVKSDIVQVRNNRYRASDTTNRFKYDPTALTSGPDAGLKLIYTLTPYPKKSLNGEVNGFTQNDSRAGSRASIIWRNRNALRGGELFTVKASGGFEIQYGNPDIRRRPNTYNLGFSVGLNIPRFLLPFWDPKPNGTFVPRTLVNLDYNYSRRGNLYTINSITLGWGYNWREDIKRDHKLFPLSLGIVRTDTIDKNAVIDVNLSNLVFNGIILGSTYEYNFNSKADGNVKPHNYFINIIADVAGNSLGLINGSTKLQEQPKTIFGSAYAQYAKLQTDFRYYYKINPKLEVAARTILGMGTPYGNSSTLPNVKQFFSGGSNSLRGFPSRLVGPGTYDYRDGNYIETLGDFKFEWNLELRQKLYSFIDLGLFFDAGNIWLFRENPNFPGGKFTKNFYKELAMDVGLGLRLDFSILILRLDFATPIRKPYLIDEGKDWTIREIDVLSGPWRRDNLFFNLAIGLPF